MQYVQYIFLYSEFVKVFIQPDLPDVLHHLNFVIHPGEKVR